MILIVGFCAFLVSQLYVYSNAKILQAHISSVKHSGESVTFECKVDTDENVFWLRQYAGSKVEHIIWYDYNKKGAYILQELQSRFIPSFNETEKTFLLVIQNLQIEDNAMYYCSDVLRTPGGLMHVSSSVPPDLFPIYPATDDTHEQTTISIGCLAVSADPNISISWNLGNPLQFHAVFDKKSKSFITSSYLTVKADDWNGGTTYTCSVNGTQTRTIKRRGTSPVSPAITTHQFLGWWVSAGLGTVLVLTVAAFIIYLYFKRSEAQAVGKSKVKVSYKKNIYHDKQNDDFANDYENVQFQENR